MFLSVWLIVIEIGLVIRRDRIRDLFFHGIRPLLKSVLPGRGVPISLLASVFIKVLFQLFLDIGVIILWTLLRPMTL